MTNITAQYPTQLADVDPAWVELALREAHAGSSIHVAGIDVQQIGEGIGFLGQLGRISVTYDGGDEALPSTLIAKFSSPLLAIRQFVAIYGMYRSEVNFYRHIPANEHLRTPRCYFAAINDEGTECALLLEDLAGGGRTGDQMAGCELEEARMAIERIGAFHAAWWNAPALESVDWLPSGVSQIRAALQTTYAMCWEACRENYGHLLTPEICEALPTLHDRLIAMIDDAVPPPTTLAHGDFRLDNLFFGSAGSDYDVAFLDWQLVNRGWGTADIAYFVATNLDTAVRRTAEMELLRAYHDRLLGGGVDGYSWEQCREDYRASMLVLLAMDVMGVMNIDAANPRGIALFNMIFTRVAAAVTDLNALDLLPA